jgi:tRNA threonylcarbamoyladenosine biosynthesis protein TsaE
MVFITDSTEQTKKVGFELARKIKENGLSKFIALRGEMGVGKTAFTSGFASYFNISAVKSPTYTVMNEYRGDGATIYHFDMYRITDGDDLYSIGYYDYIDSGAYSIVEWSENIEDFIPDDALTVTIERVEGMPNSRKITVS